MIIETVLLLSVAILTAGMLAKIYEWSQDVLYGPYIRRYD
jgi:hypothetical protein